MKIVSPKEMNDLEAQAYRNGSSEQIFMENAGRGVAIETNNYIEEHGLPAEVVLLCGKGNNAGDAYVAGIYLLSWDIKSRRCKLLRSPQQVLSAEKTTPVFEKMEGLSKTSIQ